MADSELETQEQKAVGVENRHKINKVWEYTQSGIAIIVVACTMASGMYVTFADKSEKSIPGVLLMSFGTVVGFYFGRTNHTRPAK